MDFHDMAGTTKRSLWVISRQFVPACGELCCFCPGLRTRSWKPVKRYLNIMQFISKHVLGHLLNVQFISKHVLGHLLNVFLHL
ncbi:hypothetical protein Hdeb2414_s0012g00396961 [Helianthus debilis subsp. tardiflorus]